MPVGINQPSNQIKLTNVSLVRMRKGKVSFNTLNPVPIMLLRSYSRKEKV